MRALFDDMELALTDLLQTGFATAGPDAVDRLSALSRRTEAAGLHTGSALLKTISDLLEQRAHRTEKSDMELTSAVCRLEHYITLCRERMTEDDIRTRWQEGGTL